ncbi:MAG: carbamoyl-phosphate synthase large subunit, partial [Candidatus Methanomethylophilaceae archaeon]|nr:carbamoyl-phosphate synthase large subunit [Candidatus Methanomethylophilaceae archaeon]
KALMSAGTDLPTEGGVYITVNDLDKSRATEVARSLADMGFTIYATRGTSAYLTRNGVKNIRVSKSGEDSEPDALDLMRAGDISLIINTPSEHSGAVRDGHNMRRKAVELEIPYITTMNEAEMSVGAIAVKREKELSVKSVQEYHDLRF